jgi:hypothetical protein
MIVEITERKLTDETVSADDEAQPIGFAAEASRRAVPLKTEILQNAILNSADFAIIATDAKGIIQLNVGAERKLVRSFHATDDRVFERRPSVTESVVLSPQPGTEEFSKPF